MVTASALMVTLFFGGWDIPFTAWDNTPPWTVLKFVATFAAFWAKVLFFMFAYIWVRWTLPRFRFDQLMDLGWKVLLPVALGFVMVVAVAVWALEAAGLKFGLGYALILTAVNAVLGVLLFKVLDANRVIGGTAMRQHERWREQASRARGAA